MPPVDWIGLVRKTRRKKLMTSATTTGIV